MEFRKYQHIERFGTMEVDGIEIGTCYVFPKIDTKKFNILDDQQFALDFLQEKRVLIVPGSGFNWKQPDHFRVVYLPRIEELSDATDKLEYFQDIVNKVWRGDYRNSDTGRYELLDADGYDHRVVQDLVNKGYKYKITVEDIEASHKKFGLTMEKSVESTKEVTTVLKELSDEELKNAGLTEDEISLYRALANESERTGKSMQELADEMSNMNGREMLVDSFKNIGSAILDLGNIIKDAWTAMFPPTSLGDKVVFIYNMLKAFNEFTSSLRLVDTETGELTDTGDKLQRTFKGVFAIISIVTDILGGGFKIAFKAVSALLGYFNLDILSVTAAIGDALVIFRKATDVTTLFGKAIEFVAPYVEMFASYIKSLFEKFKNLPIIQNFIIELKQLRRAFSMIDFSSPEGFKRLFEIIKAAFENIRNLDFKSAGKYIFDGLISGLWEGAKKAVEIIGNAAQSLIEKFCEITGIASPSKVFMALGGFIIAGLVLGLKDGFISVPESLQVIVDKCLAIIQNIDWGTVFAAGISIASLIFVKKLTDILESFASPFEGFGDILSEVSKVVESFGKVTKAMAFEIKTKAIKNLAVSLLILVGSIALLTLLDPTEMWNAVAVILALSVILGGLAFAVGKMSDASVSIGKNGANINGLKQNLLTIGLAMLALAVVVKIVGNMDTGKAIQGFIGLAAIMGALVGFLAITKKIVDGKTSENISSISSIMIKLSIAMGLMVLVIKLIDLLKPGEMLKGAVFASAFILFIKGLVNVTTVGKETEIAKLGGLLLSISLSMGLMVGVIKLIDLLSPGEALKGVAFVSAFLLFIKGLVNITKVDKGTEIAKLGGLLLSISLSMSLMVLVCKMVDSLSIGAMVKGAAFAAAFVLFVKGIIKVTTVDKGTELAKVSLTILSFSIALGLLAAVSMMLSLLSVEGLLKGLTAVSILGAMIALMIHASKGAENVKGSITAIAIAIGVMAVAVAGLSFIEPSKLAGAVTALSVVMGMFALLIKSANNIKGSLGTLIVMTVAIAVLGGVLWVLSTLNVQSSLANATALSALLLAVSASMFILSKSSINVKNALTGIIALMSMAVPLLAFVGVLALMQNVQNATKNVTVLVELATVLTLLLLPLTLIGYLWSGAAIGIACLTAMALPLLAFVGVLALMQNVQNATENTKALIELATALTLLLLPLTLVGYLWPGAAIGIAGLLLMSVPLLAFVGVLALMEKINNAATNTELLIELMNLLTDMLVKLAIIGPLALIGVTAMAGLTALMTAIGVLAVGVGALMQKFPELQEFLNTGIPVLEQLAFAVGSFAGNLVGGFMTGVGESLPIIGSQLSMFMTNIMPFITGIKMVDSAALAGAGYLTGAIIALTAADLVNSIVSLGSGGLVELGSQLSGFVSEAKPFLDYITTIDPAVAAGAKTIAEMILVLTATDLVSGLTSWLTGGSSLEDLGSQLADFGKAMAEFSAEVSGKIDAESVTAAANAGKALAELQSNIVGKEGVIEWFCGKKDFTTFGSGIVAFGLAIT